MFFKNKKINVFFIIVSSILLISSLSVIIIGSLDKEKKDEKLASSYNKDTARVVSDDVDGGVEGLKELNREVVAKARKSIPGRVRGIDDSDHVVGDINAPVEVIVYCDYKNEFCKNYLETVNKVIDAFKENVVVAFRHFILGSSSHSTESALASECASEQGKFLEMHDELFENYVDSPIDEQYLKIAQKIKLNKTSFDSCMKSRKFEDRILAQISEGEKFGVLGTPSTFINGEKLPGAYGFEDFVDSNNKRREGIRSVVERYLNNE
jgi:protein-disulfide isomerase